MHALAFKDAVELEPQACLRQAPPFDVELGAGLTRSAPLGLEKSVHIESDLALEHKVDGSTQFMSQNAQGFAFLRLFLQSGQKFLALWVVAQKERGRFRKGPLEVGVADFFA